MSSLQFQGVKSPSIGPKAVLTSWYLVCIAGVLLLTFAGVDQGNRAGNPDRQAVLIACAMIYVTRAATTLFAFVKRRIPWWETAWGGIPIGLVLFFILREGFRNLQPLGVVDLLGGLLYIIGSYIGTASEYSRHVWTSLPGNQGHLYTEGLFRYCRHVNYFGDLLLFIGFAVLSRQLWAGIVPLAMGLNFVFFIIPAHDAYLATHYGSEFDEYSKRSRKLVPFLY